MTICFVAFQMKKKSGKTASVFQQRSTSDPTTAFIKHPLKHYKPSLTSVTPGDEVIFHT